jgi:hypothetical protein
LKQHGRKGKAQLGLVSVDGRPPRLEPPPELGEIEREIFISLVSSVNTGHFQLSDRPLVVAYGRAIGFEQRAAQELAADPTSTRWLAVWEKAQRAMVALALRLRLSPQSRTRTGAKSPDRHGPRPWESA